MSFSKHVSIFIFLFVIIEVNAWKRCTKLRTHLQRFNEDKPRETPITVVEKIEEEKPIERKVVMNLYFSTTISKVINRQSTWTISDMKFDSINKTMYYPLWLTMIGCNPEICLYGDNRECKFICVTNESYIHIPFNEVKYTEDSYAFDIEVMLYPPLARTDFRHFRETGIFKVFSVRKFKDYLIKYTSIINQEDLDWDKEISEAASQKIQSIWQSKDKHTIEIRSSYVKATTYCESYEEVQEPEVFQDTCIKYQSQSNVYIPYLKRNVTLIAEHSFGSDKNLIVNHPKIGNKTEYLETFPTDLTVMATNVTKFDGLGFNVTYRLKTLLQDSRYDISNCKAVGEYGNFCWTYLSNYSIVPLQLSIIYYSGTYLAILPAFELGHIYFINSVQTRDGIKPYTYQDACLNNTFHDKMYNWDVTHSFCCVSWMNRQDI